MNDTHRLSREAINDLRAVYKEECNEMLSDDELEEMGWKLLRFFDILYTGSPTPKPVGIEITEQEFKALKYIHQCICHDKRQPTIRGIAQSLALKSSRSGYKAFTSLMKRGLIYRDERGDICMRKDVASCDGLPFMYPK